MPLEKGRSKKVQSQNIKEMMDAYGKTGKIGNTRPRNRKHAQKIAIAASYTAKRKSKSRRKKL